DVDGEGRLIDSLTNARVDSAPLPSRDRSTVIAVALGDAELPSLRVALQHHIVTGLITDARPAQKIAGRGRDRGIQRPFTRGRGGGARPLALALVGWRPNLDA